MTKSPIRRHISCLLLCLSMTGLHLPLSGCTSDSDDPMMKAAPIVLGVAVGLGAVYALVKNGDKNATEPTPPSSSSGSSSGSSGSSGQSDAALVSNACNTACKGQKEQNTCSALCVSQATSCVVNQKRSASSCASDAVAKFVGTPGTVKPALVPQNLMTSGFKF